MEKLALPPGTNWPHRREVTSENLIGYLGNNPYFDTQALDFAPDLDLGWCSKFMKQIVRAKRVAGFILPEETRFLADEAQKSSQLVKKHGLPLARLVFKILEAVTEDREEVFRRAPVERFKLAYWDFENESESVKSTRVIYGEHDSVLSGAAHRKVDQLGNTPLLGIHTHRRDALFSSDDDSNLISEDSYYPHHPKLRGNIVVCLNVQLLALATPNSPTVPPRLAREWANSARESFDQLVGKESEFLDKWEERFYKKVRPIPKMEYDFLESMRGLPDQESAARYKIYYRKWRDFLVDLTSVYLSVSQIAKDRADAKTNRLSNHLLHQFYRDLELKLYMSTDMRHFKEFSA